MFKYLFICFVWLTPTLGLAAECSTTTAGPYSQAIQLSELLPNPATTESQDEFIEVYNSGDAAVDLTGWQLRDTAGTTYTVTGIVSAHRYFSWYRSDSKISLNNNGDSITLLQPDGTVVETISYTDSAADDTSYALNSSGQWSWTSLPTPYTANQFPSTADGSDESENNASNETTTDTTRGFEYSRDIMLSELLPDPAGSDATDEWIELYNGGEAINLYGWLLTDGSSDYDFPDESVSAGSYMQLTIGETGVSLNNSGETIQLIDPDGAVVSEVTYSEAAAGESYAQLNSSWQWTTTLTPAASNVITHGTSDGDADSTNGVDAGESGTSTEQAAQTTISTVRAMSSGADVTFTGTVLVLPEIYSSNYFYVQDDTAGVQVYSSSKDFPTLTVGDIVTITGKTSSSNGEPKVNISSSDDIVISSHTETITPLSVTTVDAAHAGRLVTLTATITAKSGSTISTDHGDVYIKRGTTISTSSLNIGQTYTITGVVVVTTDATQLWPRSAADIVTNTTSVAAGFSEAVLPAAQAAEFSNTGAQYQVPQSTDNTDHPYWLIGVAIIAGLVALAITLWQRVPWLSVLLRNWIWQRVHAWGGPLGRWVASKRNTTGLDGQNQYRGLHISDKTTASTDPLNPLSGARYVPTQNPHGAIVRIPHPIINQPRSIL